MTEATDQRLIPLEPVRTEILVVNSRFIADLVSVDSVEQARAHQAEVRARHPNASHHVPAFIIGHGKSIITHCSDDGEPSGTAGRPALAVLQGSGLGDVSVIVTRYFGGTKLGTGGLVRAYGDAVREVLKQVKVGILLATTTLSFTIPYRLYDQIIRLTESHEGQVLDTAFEADVTIKVRLKDDKVQSFSDQLINHSAGMVRPTVVERESESVFPLN